MISNKTTPVNEFPPSLVSELNSTLERVAQEKKGQRLVAAFDADGTLWDTDAGEAFFDYQIHHSGLQGLPSDPWKYYEDEKKKDPRVAYTWLAQISAGHSLERVRSWAKDCFERQKPFPYLRSQRDLVATLRRLNYEVYIVTASVKWAVEPIAESIGVDFDHVLGITTKVVDGVVTAEPNPPVTWRQGKADAILRATGGVRPVFCSGNTDGDQMLLETASHIALAVSTQNSPSKLNDSESNLRAEAIKRGWKTHAFRPAID